MGLYGNIQVMVNQSMPSWQLAHKHSLTGIRTIGFEDGRLIASDGHRFINKASCSYLGLNRHPAVVKRVIDARIQENTMSTWAPRARIAPALMDETESLIATGFGAEAISTPSAMTAWAHTPNAHANCR